MKQGNLTGATELWGKLEEVIGHLTANVDWYNVLVHHTPEDDQTIEGRLAATVLKESNGKFTGSISCMHSWCRVALRAALHPNVIFES